jgi:hypothetical protein
MRWTMLSTIAAAAAMLWCAAAPADTMHPRLAARLSGMGEHGIVNFQSQATNDRICWTFELSASGIVAASIRDAHGMVVARLGKAYRAKGCAAVAKKALELIESKPSSYVVWVDTKGHPGDLRGRLFAGMAHM